MNFRSTSTSWMSCSNSSDMRNGPSRCPVDNEPPSESEFSNGGQGCVPSDNSPLVEPPAEQEIAEQGQQPVYQQGNDEQGVGASFPDEETEQSLSQERHPTNQQGDDGQVNGLAYLMASGGKASEVSRPIPEMEDVAGHGLNASGRQLDYQQSGIGRSSDLNHSLLNDGEGVSREESSVQESFACQLVNGLQQQPRYQQNAQANALRYPTQEVGQDALQRRDRQEVPYPIQETGHFEDEHEELLPCELNGADMNGVCSTGQTKQAVEHNCSQQELQLWKQELDRCKPQKATRNKMNSRETFFILEIPEVRQRRQGDVNGEPIAFFSSAIHTDRYEYKFGIRVYLCGVDNGRYVAMFVHMMEGKHDDLLQWPFRGTITLSILDRSGAKNNDISQIVQATRNVSAFQRPREAICRTGCGFVKFAPIEQVFGPHYLKKDKLFVKIEFSDETVVIGRCHCSCIFCRLTPL